MESILPRKPGCHRKPFNPNNCQADREYNIEEDKKHLDCLMEHSQNSKHTSNRRQEKYDRSKLEHFNGDSRDLPRKRVETNIKSLNGYQTSHKDKIENDMRLTYTKKVLLQEKLLKAAENIRKVQLRTAFEDKVKEEQRNARKAENSLYYTEKGNGDRESTIDWALGGRIHEGKQEGFNIWVKEKNGMEKQENHIKETTKEKRGKGIVRENRNTRRTTKTVEKQWEHFEEMTRNTQERAITERDDTRRERVVEWERNKIREWDQIDWQGKEIMRGNDRKERRHELVKCKKEEDIGNEVQQWDVMDRFALNSPIKVKAVFSHDKRNVLIKDNLATPQRVHRYSNRDAEEITFKQPLPEAGLSTPNGKRLQQGQLGQKSNHDADLKLVRCEVCNRNFKEDRLEKHISICQKLQKPKRQVYSSSQYRAKGTELEKFMKTNGQFKAAEHKKSEPCQKTDPSVETICKAHAPAVRGFQTSADPNSHITCPHCTRRFAPRSAERHIPKCQHIKSRPPPPRQRHQT